MGDNENDLTGRMELMGIGSAGICFAGGTQMVMAQIFAVLIFIGMFVLVISERVERHTATLTCALLTLLIVFSLCMRDTGAIMEALNIGSIFRSSFWFSSGEAAESGGINWETIFFITGMMVMVEGMAENGVFRWLCILLAKASHYKPVPIFMTFMLLSAVLAMFVDSITVVVFLAAATMELSRLLKFDPVPMIMAEIFCANLGGSATMCGDPPNIIIGTSLNYSFGDFITNTGLIAGVSLVLVLVYFFLMFRKKLVSAKPDDELVLLSARAAIHSIGAFITSCVIFFAAVALLVTHARTGLTVSYIGVIIALSTLILSGDKAKAIIRRVDFKTVLFFVGLFVVISGLEQTGVLEWLAGLISSASGGRTAAVVAIILFGSGIASAFIDNIPFAATMIPVIRSIAATQGVALPVMAWSLAMGTDIGGNATPIGASANVVGMSIAAKGGHFITWGRFLRTMVIPTLVVLGVSLAIIIIRYV